MDMLIDKSLYCQHNSHDFLSYILWTVLLLDCSDNFKESNRSNRQQRHLLNIQFFYNKQKLNTVNLA